MKNRKEIYLLIGLAVVLFLILMGIAFMALVSKPAKDISTNAPSPSLLTSPSPTPLVNSGVPPVSYSSDATDRLIEKVKNHPQLSDSDLTAKQKILSLLQQGKSSGYVYESQNIRLEYLNSPDAFLAEILTFDIAKAKTDAVTWFKSQGMSQAGICNLPISFYLNSGVANELRTSNIIFNPLPDGC